MATRRHPAVELVAQVVVVAFAGALLLGDLAFAGLASIGIQEEGDVPQPDVRWDVAGVCALALLAAVVAGLAILAATRHRPRATAWRLAAALGLNLALAVLTLTI